MLLLAALAPMAGGADGPMVSLVMLAHKGGKAARLQAERFGELAEGCACRGASLCRGEAAMRRGAGACCSLEAATGRR